MRSTANSLESHGIQAGCGNEGLKTPQPQLEFEQNPPPLEYQWEVGQ